MQYQSSDEMALDALRQTTTERMQVAVLDMGDENIHEWMKEGNRPVMLTVWAKNGVGRHEEAELH